MFTEIGPGQKSSGGGAEQPSVWKNPLLYTSSALGVAILVVGGIFFFRWSENRDITRRTIAERTEKQQEQDRVTLEQMGGKSLEIQNFYASPATVQRGEKVKLCYGVANAKTVKLEPSTEPVWPSYARCVDDKPTKETTYTLTIEDGAGHSKASSLTVKVR
ncbi:MAG TPA: hypothetical protein VGI16_06175 [Candidatus Acidoferrum sp.]|jgi:hypothetical protein